MRVFVITTEHPDGTPRRLEHGPFRSFLFADEYILALRSQWGVPEIEDRTPQFNGGNDVADRITRRLECRRAARALQHLSDEASSELASPRVAGGYVGRTRLRAI